MPKMQKSKVWHTTFKFWSLTPTHQRTVPVRCPVVALQNEDRFKQKHKKVNCFTDIKPPINSGVILNFRVTRGWHDCLQSIILLLTWFPIELHWHWPPVMNCFWDISHKCIHIATLTFQSHVMSFGYVTIRFPIYDFLQVFHWNQHSISISRY